MVIVGKDCEGQYLVIFGQYREKQYLTAILPRLTIQRRKLRDIICDYGKDKASLVEICVFRSKLNVPFQP